MQTQSTSQPVIVGSTEPCANCKRIPVEKIWGISVPLYQDQHIEVARMAVRCGGHSARHKHLHKNNTFVVVRGRLLVTRYDEDGGAIERVLTPREESYTVPSDVEHRFLGLDENSVVYEIYVAEEGHVIDPSDIIRRDQGDIGNGSLDIEKSVQP